MWSLKHVKLFKSFQNTLVDFKTFLLYILLVSLNIYFNPFCGLFQKLYFFIYCYILKVLFKKSFLWFIFEIKPPSFMLFYGILCVPFYSINDCPVNRKWMVVFLSVQFFSEGKLYSSTSLIYYIAYRNIISRRNIRIYPGTRRGFLRSSGQHWINWSPDLWFGGTKDPWFFNLQYRQASVHNPIILCNFL